MSQQNNTATLEPKSYPSILILITLAIGFIMATLDVTIVNVALPSIQGELKMSLSDITWIIDGYILTFASLLLVSGALANRYGAKTAYMTGLVVFLVASLLCAIAPTGNILIAARFFQGVGAALFMPSSLGLLALAYPDDKQRAKMFGLWAAIISIASGLGPFIGGVLVNTFGWRSIFFINLPIGIIGLLLTYWVVSQSPKMQSILNFVSHGLGIIMLAGLSFTLVEGPSLGWGSLPIISSLILTLIVTTLFIMNEGKSATPIIPTQLFNNPHFSAANLIGFLINFSIFGGIFMFALFLQQERGATPFEAGLELLPIMIVFSLGNLIFARFVTNFGSRAPMLVGLSVASIGFLLLVFIAPTTPYWLLAVIFAAANLGVGITVPAMTATVMQAAGRSHANIAGATLNVNRQIGALVGIAVIGIVLHGSIDWYSKASTSFLIIGIMLLIAVFLVWQFIRTSKT